MLNNTKKIFQHSAFSIQHSLEWNPQLFRELKGRVTARNLTITLIASFAIQFSLYLLFGNDIAFPLSYLLPWILLVGGSYQLSHDLAKEEARGTLNFIRLSPQSSQAILIGKMLGVPVMLYLGVSLAIPLHCLAWSIQGYPVLAILGQYISWATGCLFFYTFAFFYTLSFNPSNRLISNPQSIAWSLFVVVWFLSSIYRSIIQVFITFHFTDTDKLSWFFIPLGNHPLLVYVWIWMTLAGITYLMWKAVNRRFRNPNRTLLSKSHSYQLAIAINLWVLGFFVPYPDYFNGTEVACGWLFIGIPLFSLLLISLLSPNRQTQLDWARYRHRDGIKNHRNLWQDLMWGEKSPGVVAGAIALLIALVIWIPWLSFVPQQQPAWDELSKPQLIVGSILTVGIVAIYGAIAQILSIGGSKSVIFKAFGLGSAIALPTIAGGIVVVARLNFPLIWTISPAPVVLFLQSGSLVTGILGIFLQLAILGILTRQLTKRFQKAGRSATKALLASHL